LEKGNGIRLRKTHPKVTGVGQAPDERGDNVKEGPKPAIFRQKKRKEKEKNREAKTSNGETEKIQERTKKGSNGDGGAKEGIKGPVTANNNAAEGDQKKKIPRKSKNSARRIATL